MGGQEKQDFSDFILVMGIILMLIFQYIIHYKYHWFVNIFYVVKYPIYEVISYIPENYLNKFYFWVFWDENYSSNIKNVSRIFQTYSLEQFTNEKYMDEELAVYGIKLREYVSYVNNITRILYIPFLIPILLYFKKNIQNKERFNTVYTIETLGFKESVIWPQIRPVVYEYDDFVQTKDLDSGWFSMSRKPFDYFVHNNLLIESINNNKEDLDNFGKKFYKIDIEKMYNFYINELGKPFKSINDLEDYEKAVLSIIIPKMFKDVETSERMNKNLSIVNTSYPKFDNRRTIFKLLLKSYKKGGFKKLNKSLAKRKINRKKFFEIKKEVSALKPIVEKDIDLIMKKYFPEDIVKRSLFGKKIKSIEKAKKPKEIEDVLNRHFYKKTVFSALLIEARKTGVLASCEFIWLKKHNKDIWYMMSQVGRTACFSESAGAWSHFLAEKSVERKLVSPMVRNAIIASDKYLEKHLENYDPINKVS